MRTSADGDQADHRRRTRDAYDRLAAVWAGTTDEGPFNGLLERPALRALVPRPLTDKRILDAGCGSGAQAEWLLQAGADVIGLDIGPRMVEEATQRCAARGRFLVADLAEPLPIEPYIHYVKDSSAPLRSFAQTLRPGGWVVVSLDHHFGPPTPTQRGGYFDTELVSDTWTKGEVEVTQQFWRRPLSATVGAFADDRFVVERVAEPQPSGSALRQFPDELAALVGVPTFIVYRLLLRS